jgi:hypothetical protein
MIYNSDTHHRHSIRLKDYDYSQAGAYFITICAQNRECLFGEIANGKMWLNNAGQMVEKWYHELTNKYPDIIELRKSNGTLSILLHPPHPPLSPDHGGEDKGEGV